MIHLTFDNLTYQVGSHTILSSLKRRTPSFQCLGVIGGSGAGKTTLLRVLSGLIQPSSGSVQIHCDDDSVFTISSQSNQNDMHAFRLRTAMVFQSYNLFPHLSAARNITLPLERVHKKPKKEACALALSALEDFGLLDCKDRLPRFLSGGQQQRVALARARAIGADIVFLDEPTSALDPESTVNVLSVVERMKDEGRVVILVTHHMGFALTVPDQLIFMADGDINAMGTPQEFCDNPQTPELRRFLEKELPLSRLHPKGATS